MKGVKFDEGHIKVCIDSKQCLLKLVWITFV